MNAKSQAGIVETIELAPGVVGLYSTSFKPYVAQPVQVVLADGTVEETMCGQVLDIIEMDGAEVPVFVWGWNSKPEGYEPTWVAPAYREGGIPALQGSASYEAGCTIYDGSTRIYDRS